MTYVERIGDCAEGGFASSSGNSVQAGYSSWHVPATATGSDSCYSS